jgi:hypothetical protein
VKCRFIKRLAVEKTKRVKILLSFAKGIDIGNNWCILEAISAEAHLMQRQYNAERRFLHGEKTNGSGGGVAHGSFTWGLRQN